MYVYRKEEIREIDREAEEKGLSVFTLMENAGSGLYRAISKRITKQQTVCIVCGKGNNGGDGIVLGRYLLQNGYHAKLYFPFGLPEIDKPAGRHLTYLKSCGFSPVTEELTADVWIDGLLGIGFRQPLRKEASEAISFLNRQQGTKIAIDLPSGVEADSGNTDEAFQADFTYCLHGFKPSAFSHPSKSYYGEAEVVDVGLPRSGKIKIWTENDAVRALPSFQTSAHKGTFGTGYLIAGSDEMPGSVLLAGMGALRSGIGKLTIGTTRFAAGIAAGVIPESTYELEGLQKTANGYVPEKIKAAAIGPGLEDGEVLNDAIHVLLKQDIPVVLDAGALKERSYPKRDIPPILTPHPGEFSRISGLSVQEIQSSRIDSALTYARKHRVILVLKGEQTVIAFPDGEAIVNQSGNAALAKGGSGDTLTGMLTAFLCTHRTVKEAIANAVYIHGKTADRWIEKYGERTMTASDISALLPEVIKHLERKKEG
ncbi:NAD(P)H-hydrate dehydratase [Bacillus sp. FJAT-42376]|uniref:NAD(P)H-hydrate dehydratase n=1 Tax=Bacillus sp. FJAT-42376 TaxID=2014076 RepID=UPI000F4DCD44|nr:NAD(P)H-hydrate dehydratase [Bacillus sp. FJAT-42376]AZB42757.1 NAD(P)H-hydrate dehydratase [Bacillus sp. FJAT-42376]